MSQKKSPKALKGSPKKSAKPLNKKPFKPWWFWFFQLLAVLLVCLTVWAVWLDAQVRERFDGRKWTLPAKVYARPLMLYPGQLLSPAQLLAELKWADYHFDPALAYPG
ncbi:MAG: penicillin-binding protein 1B, partial [Venatoribacter sp.]